MTVENKTLPNLDNTIPVLDARIEEFQRNGHTLIRNILTKDEVDAYYEVIHHAALKYNNEKRRIEDRDTYGKAFLQIMNLWEEDERAKKFVLAKRFAKIAADLMGVKNVRLYHDQALFKEPGGGPTPWHQDQNYWPLNTTKTITMWMPLVDIPNSDMGMLTFASGSHLKGIVSDSVISDQSEDVFGDYVAENNFEISRPTSLKAGDATFHHGFTVHNAPGNSSNTMREVITIIYFEDGATVADPQHKWQENDHQRWLMGKEVGTKADSALNPLLL